MTVRYLIKDPASLVRYLGCNLLPKRHYLYTSFVLPPDADELAVDAKLLLKYDCHLSKEQRHRRTKGGIASVRYLRCGRVGLFVATRGTSPFFGSEPWRDVREKPLHAAGHMLGVRADGTVSVSLHRTALERFELGLMENVRLPLRQLERLVWDCGFVPFKGVQKDVARAVKHLNACRKALRMLPVDPDNCVRRRFKVEPAFLPTPPEVAELLAWRQKQR